MSPRGRLFRLYSYTWLEKVGNDFVFLRPWALSETIFRGSPEFWGGELVILESLLKVVPETRVAGVWYQKWSGGEGAGRWGGCV